MRRVLITNRRSRANRKRPQQAERLALGLGADLLHPETLDALDALAPQLGDAEEIFVHGGDGTLHRVLTAMYRAGVDLARPSFSIAKAGITTVLNSRAAVLAAANPPSVGLWKRTFIDGALIFSSIFFFVFPLRERAARCDRWPMTIVIVCSVIRGSPLTLHQDTPDVYRRPAEATGITAQDIATVFSFRPASRILPHPHDNRHAIRARHVADRTIGAGTTT